MTNPLGVIFTVLLVVAAFLAGNRIGSKNATGLPTDNKQASTTPAAQAAPTQVPFNPTKSDKPEVKFFVMSFCPYGNQAEVGLEPVYQLLKGKVDLLPRYIVSGVDQATIDQCKQSCPNKVANDNARTQCQTAIDNKQVTTDVDTCVKTYFPYKDAATCITKECNTLKVGSWESLHGSQELNQNVREICAYKQGDNDKWWKFVGLVNANCSAQNADTCWKEQASAAGYDTAKLTACEKSEANTLLNSELAESTKYKASGSPTVLINGTLYNGGRAPEDYKQAICSAFNNPPEECKTVLGSASAETAAGGCN